MPRLLVPDAFHPILQFRYQVTTSKLAGAQFYARSAGQPKADTAPVRVEYVNSYFNVHGKVRWNNITLSCYNFEGITIQEIWKYFQDHQQVPSATDMYRPSYGHDLKLQLLNPMEAPITTWTLVGAFFATVDWGAHDRGTDDVSQAEVEVVYDHAILG
jgi:hypothetical protein